jgi:hypothetical protein
VTVRDDVPNDAATGGGGGVDKNPRLEGDLALDLKPVRVSDGDVRRAVKPQGGAICVVRARRGGGEKFEGGGCARRRKGAQLIWTWARLTTNAKFVWYF